MSEIKGKSANELAENRTTLAVQRTLMAADRSLMAWIRTGLSMITFGFTLYRVLESFQTEGASLNHSPRTIGLFLIGLGIGSIQMGTYEYWSTLRGLRSYEPIRMWRASLSMATIMSVLGVALFVGTITNLF
jgi:putative membrane protein